MAYATFGSKWTVSANAPIHEDTHFNDPGDGIQDEFELRQGDLLDGVTSGLACTTSGTNVAIAAGRAYVAGKRYSGNANVSMVGKASGDYWAYIDSADDTTPYKVKTTAPTSGELALATVSWNGTAFIDPYVDDQRKVQGIERVVFPFTFPGALVVGQEQMIQVPGDLWLEDDALVFSCSENGSVSGNVTLDLLLGADGAQGTTVFTTASRRPSIATSAANYTQATCVHPDGDRRPDEGEHLTVVIDAIDGGPTASTCSGEVRARYR